MRYDALLSSRPSLRPSLYIPPDHLFVAPTNPIHTYTQYSTYTHTYLPPIPNAPIVHHPPFTPLPLPLASLLSTLPPGPSLSLVAKGNRFAAPLVSCTPDGLQGSILHTYTRADGRGLALQGGTGQVGATGNSSR